MDYVITNGKNYLLTDRKNNISTTVSSMSAKIFHEEKKAINFAKSLPKPLKNLGYKVMAISTSKSELPEYTAIKTPDGVVNHIKRKYQTETDQAAAEKINPDEIIKKVIACESALIELRSLCNIAKQKQMESDKAIFDIEHAAEFFEYNASDGYKLYKKLHEARILRRKCKDSVYIMESILSASMTDILTGVPTKRILGMENRRYTPRVLTEFFPSEMDDPD